MNFIEELRRIRESIQGGSTSNAAANVPWRARLREISEAMKLDPWERALRNFRGVIGKDGVERVSTCELFDFLEIAEALRARGAVRLSVVMEKLGWQRVRMHRLNRCGYSDRVRGYARRIIP